MPTDARPTARPAMEFPPLAALDGPAANTRAALAATFDQSRATVDPLLLELAALSVAAMLRSRVPRTPVLVEPERAAAVPEWRGSDLFTERERACLALADQFVFAVGSVDDDLVAQALKHLQPAELYAFVNALYVLDVTERLELALDGLHATEDAS
jgi:alkylhydroperoxidase family enzyme